MTQPESLEDLFEQAVEAIPYDLEPTSITMGELEPDSTGYVEYSEEFTFKVGQLFDMDLIAGGWVELRQEDGEVTITAFMGIARDGDWQKGRILPDDSALQGVYDLENETWEFWIDQF
ncbi:MAG TPA: hypothetical protein PKD55_23145 [Bellilinea sp.]|jgi:hypothetical protein|nr:hypothetical protein [Bellilinea sp.]